MPQIELDTFPTEKQLDSDGARAEFERTIGEPNYGDFPVGRDRCYYCGCRKEWFIDGRCPGCADEEE